MKNRTFLIILLLLPFLTATMVYPPSAKNLDCKLYQSVTPKGNSCCHDRSTGLSQTPLQADSTPCPYRSYCDGDDIDIVFPRLYSDDEQSNAPRHFNHTIINPLITAEVVAITRPPPRPQLIPIHILTCSFLI